jgi:hypothetical protein
MKFKHLTKTGNYESLMIRKWVQLFYEGRCFSVSQGISSSSLFETYHSRDAWASLLTSAHNTDRVRWIQGGGREAGVKAPGDNTSIHVVTLFSSRPIVTLLPPLSVTDIRSLCLGLPSRNTQTRGHHKVAGVYTARLPYTKRWLRVRWTLIPCRRISSILTVPRYWHPHSRRDTDVWTAPFTHPT